MDLSRLADDRGHLRILAIDQRSALRKLIAQVRGADRPIAREDVIAFKRAVISNLGSCSTAVLVDDEYSYPACLDVVPRGRGLLFPAEESDYERAGSQGREFRERLGWNVENVLKAKPDGIKLLLHYRGDGAADVVEHQRSIAREVGEFCQAHGLVFVLEPLTYPLFDDEIGASLASLAWARRRPEIILDFAREFSKPEYSVGILKLEFPVDLQLTEGTGLGPGKPKIFTPDDVRRYCAQLDSLTPLPWAILSLGVSNDEFAAQLEFAVAAGACGFVCGRSIWKSAIPFLGDPTALDRELRTSCRANFERFNAIMANARPWRAKYAAQKA